MAAHAARLSGGDCSSAGSSGAQGLVGRCSRRSRRPLEALTCHCTRGPMEASGCSRKLLPHRCCHTTVEMRRRAGSAQQTSRSACVVNVRREIGRLRPGLNTAPRPAGAYLSGSAARPERVAEPEIPEDQPQESRGVTARACWAAQRPSQHLEAQCRVQLGARGWQRGSLRT